MCRTCEKLYDNLEELETELNDLYRKLEEREITKELLQELYLISYEIFKIKQKLHDDQNG